MMTLIEVLGLAWLLALLRHVTPVTALVICLLLVLRHARFQDSDQLYKIVYRSVHADNSRLIRRNVVECGI